MISVYHADIGAGDGQSVRGYHNAVQDAIQLIRHYTVETEAEAVKQLREALTELHARVQTCVESPPPQFASDLRGILRNYRDCAASYIHHLRQDIRSTSETLSTLLDVIQTGTSASQATLRNEIDHLQTLIKSEDIEEIRAGVEKSTVALAECAERVEREKNSLICQLKIEILELHRSLEEAQQKASVDPVTGMLRKREFIRLVRRSLIAGDPIGIICVRLENIRALRDNDESAQPEILGAFSRRLRNVVPREAHIGAWNDGTVCIMAAAQSMPAVSGRIAGSCGGRYVYAHGSKSYTFNLKIDVSSVTREPADDADAFVSKIDGITVEMDPVPTVTAGLD